MPHWQPSRRAARARRDGRQRGNRREWRRRTSVPSRKSLPGWWSGWHRSATSRGDDRQSTRRAELRWRRPPTPRDAGWPPLSPRSSRPQPGATNPPSSSLVRAPGRRIRPTVRRDARGRAAIQQPQHPPRHIRWGRRGIQDSRRHVRPRLRQGHSPIGELLQWRGSRSSPFQVGQGGHGEIQTLGPSRTQVVVGIVGLDVDHASLRSQVAINGHQG